ncbi:pantetheine-phosphate adenylyltransferase [Odoribacter sp. OttesenSCG-928-L07]|nr:pantetheine-phosphate adenylyltransferase [Odoribacter sp. OttesenSCG-928-L07]MDL2239520.1 pantetheine-phosphate adenylyltransferase [Bacteroidales bacterium OttesenSCG-928-L14]
MTKRIAVFPGSFDPVTQGHEAIILRALNVFDEIIVAVGVNIEKRYLFSVETRTKWIKQTFKDYPQVRVESYTGLTVDFCKKVGSKFIIRGLRTSADFEFERIAGQVNKKLSSDIETVFLLAAPEFTALNSSVVRDIVINGGNASIFVPEGVIIRPEDLEY